MVPAADALYKARNKYGSPSSDLQKETDTKEQTGPTAEKTQADFEQNRMSYTPIWLENRGGCTYPECPGKSCTAWLMCCVTVFQQRWKLFCQIS
jgi:hypothetical protein